MDVKARAKYMDEFVKLVMGQLTIDQKYFVDEIANFFHLYQGIYGLSHSAFYEVDIYSKLISEVRPKILERWNYITLWNNIISCENSENTGRAENKWKER